METRQRSPVMHRLYYQVKPFLPPTLRLAVRRAWIRKQREAFRDVWPINEPAGRKPVGWPGWPDGKQFALVLTHDIESQKGIENVKPLTELEMSLGFCSSFNFIPKGSYRVPQELRDWLTSHGFEVGVHDLYHDGKLYRSKKDFARCARSINQYLEEWNAVGFRSGFMLRNLEWLAELDIAYDTSTFDTDPFEPQPDGVNTIFPFWVPRVRKSSPLARRPSSFADGYVELPYTLPQDSTLFLLMEEKTIDLWKQKLDWIAERGGMVLLDSHPDYMNFGGRKMSSTEYPVKFYQQLLDYIRAKYEGAYWLALPRQVASYVAEVHQANIRNGAHDQGTFALRKNGAKSRSKVWIDLDNTPHVPFFKPIIQELEQRGYSVVLTARDAFQVCELVDRSGLKYARIGRHYGKIKLIKGAGLFLRALQLLPLIQREKPAIGISHGSRSQIILGNLLRIPTVLLEDYEFAQFPPLMRPSWKIAPNAIPDAALQCDSERIRKYSGIKEDVYVPAFKPDPAFPEQFRLAEDDILVTVRPPATEAHYHCRESEVLFEETMKYLHHQLNVRVVLLPRNHKQEAWIKHKWPEWFADGRVFIPQGPLDGLNLLWHSDLVVSGGGTMNREAAALGVPVYSIFRGTIGAVDRSLQQQRRLVLLESTDDVRNKIVLQRRKKNGLPNLKSQNVLDEVVTHIENILQLTHPSVGE